MENYASVVFLCHVFNTERNNVYRLQDITEQFYGISVGETLFTTDPRFFYKKHLSISFSES